MKLTIAQAAIKTGVTPQGMHFLIQRYGLKVERIHDRCFLLASSELRKIPKKVAGKRKSKVSV